MRSHSPRWLTVFSAGFLVLASLALRAQAQADSSPPTLQALNREVEQAFRANDLPRMVGALLTRSERLGQNGRWEAAIEAATLAVEFAGKTADSRRAGAFLGGLYVQTNAPQQAQKWLLEAQKEAEAANDTRLLAAIYNDLGLLQARTGRENEASEAWKNAADLANQTSQFGLVARTHLNRAQILPPENKRELGEAFEAARAAIEKVARAPQIELLLAFGEAQLRLGSREESSRESQILNRENAKTSFERALDGAKRWQNVRLQSLALGNLGQIAESDLRLDDALSQTRQARFLAQESQDSYLLYRWEWQIGRLQRQKGETQGAIASLRRAISTFRGLNDCGGPTAFGGSREAQPLYYQLADLLFQDADQKTKNGAGEREIQALLTGARDTIELLKTAELSDYFRDDCVAAARAKTRDLSAILGRAAVVYFIPLPDRTEILVETRAGLNRVTVESSAPILAARARRLRLQLQRPGSEAFLPLSRELYNRLLRPLEPILAQNKIETLVFVSDGALRTVPLGALNDGEKFLIERFQIAVAPALTLTDPQPLSEKTAKVFVGGLSEGVAGFAPLENVPREVAAIRANYPGTVLLNTQFVKPEMKAEISGGDFSVVHLASHGEFSAQAENSFLLAYDGKVTLGDLERMIRPRQFRGTPVELLVLSACQTAEGDDRAALGLAGVAVKAGARSALASLWSVSDEATASLVGEFYAGLRQNPNQSKAAALQKAQLKLLRDEKFAHPSFWAPYLLIGNWL